MIRPVRPDGRIETGGVFVPILRRRVLERIASAAMQRVVLLVAPAGYGKSVALRHYLDSINDPRVSFDVLPEHAALLGFLRGFADALAEIAPDLRSTLAGAYERNASSPTAGADLAMWVHSHMKAYRGIIAIDDLQVAQEDREVTRFLSSLIDRTKGRVQWIIASRSTVGLPIGTWLAYGDSDLAIDEHDLRFTVEEAKEAARSFKLGVRDEELYELIHLTEGWATAMSFALRSSTRSVDLRNISSMTRDMIYRYLAEQVYHALSNDEREFLESAALLSEIEVDVMVDAGFDRAAAMIEDLRQRVSFVHEQSPGLYRLHDLFREFLLHQLTLGGDMRARELRQSIGSVVENKNEFAKALELFLGASSFGDVLRILDTQGLHLLARGHADIVQRAVEEIEAANKTDTPVTLRLRGVLEIAAGRYEEGERHLLKAAKAGGQKKMTGELLIRTAMSRLNRGNDAAPVLRSAIDDNELPKESRLEAQAILAIVASRSGEIAEGRGLVNDVSGALHDLEDNALRARVMQRLGIAYVELGQLDAARSFLAKAGEIASGLGLWSLASRCFAGLAGASIFAEADSTLCLWYAQQAANCATKAGDYYDLQASLLHILNIETQRGNVDRVAQIEKQLGEFRTNDAVRSLCIAASQAHRRAWSGQFAEASRLFGSVKARITYPPDRAFINATHALCLALDGQPRESGVAVEDALQIVDEALKNSTDFGSTQLEAALLFLALAEAIAGRHTAAQRLIKRSSLSNQDSMLVMREAVSDLVRAARSQSYIVEDLGSRTDVLDRDGFGGYARYLILAGQVVEDGHQALEAVKLTPSELRIIRLLAAGMAPKDVAAEMGRSVYTIQTHIQNLIEKLGCHGRAEAIAAARRMGLLDEVQ